MLRRVSLLLLAVLFPVSSVSAYIEAPMTLADVVNQSNIITILRVVRVEKTKNLIVYEKVDDIRGKFPTANCRHVISGQLKEGEIKTVLDWAEPGKTAIFFAKDGACETCIDNYWYQVYKQGDDLYGMSHGEPFLLRAYAGKAERLPPYVRSLLENKEVIVPAMEDNKDLLHKRAGRIMRLRTSLKNLNYDVKRDFAGWGAEDIRRLPNPGAFSHIAPLGRVDQEARSIMALDIDGDGRTDLSLISSSTVKIYLNQGESFNEVTLPGYRGGARSAAWADFNGDAKPDLVLATAEGPKLFSNLGGGQFRDESSLLPRDAAGAHAVAVMDADGDGLVDLLVATSFNGLRLYRNLGNKERLTLQNVTSGWGLADYQGSDGMMIVDVNGDGKADLITHRGDLFINQGDRFALSRDAGIVPGGKIAAMTYLDRNGTVDVLIAHEKGCQLYRNDGSGKFADVTAMAGDLAKPMSGLTCVTCGDFNNDGQEDLFLGVLRGPNRYLESNGDGTYRDRTSEVGFLGKISNTQAACWVDINGDGKLDLAMLNEGQESHILLGNKEIAGKATAIEYSVPPELLGKNLILKLTGPSGSWSHQISGGETRGQQQLLSRFTIAPGSYQLEITSNGKSTVLPITVDQQPQRIRPQVAPKSKQ